MRKVALLVALVLGLGISTMASDVKPSAKTEVQIAHNGYNLMEVKVASADQSVARVKVYDADFNLIHSEKIDTAEPKYFDISKLEAGQYLIKVEQSGLIIHTEVVSKLKK